MINRLLRGLNLVPVHCNARPQLGRSPILVDLRFYDSASATAKLAAGHDYLCWAVRYGRPVFERRRWSVLVDEMG